MRLNGFKLSSGVSVDASDEGVYTYVINRADKITVGWRP